MEYMYHSICFLLNFRFEQTTAEAKKIAEVKEELQKLDAELAADVTILRKEIEAAALNYAHYKWEPNFRLQIQDHANSLFLVSRKNYDRIESQFLKAKLELHQSLEKKEMLTEHLCTIIAHNEDRKAKKLSDLMEKVGISPEVELPSSTNNQCSNGTAVDSNGNWSSNLYGHDVWRSRSSHHAFTHTSEQFVIYSLHSFLIYTSWMNIYVH